MNSPILRAPQGDEDNKRQSVAEVKASLSARLLCARLPPALRSFTDAVLSLGCACDWGLPMHHNP